MSGMAVVLGVIQEQLAEMCRKIDHLVAGDAAKDARLRQVEMDVVAIKAQRDRKPSQWPAVASAIGSMVSVAFVFFALVYTK
jgi:hypothetical protein